MKVASKGTSTSRLQNMNPEEFDTLFSALAGRQPPDHHLKKIANSFPSLNVVIFLPSILWGIKGHTCALGISSTHGHALEDWLCDVGS